MKLALTLLAVLAISGCVKNGGGIEEDKIGHFAVGAGISGFAQSLGATPEQGFGLAVLAGIGKEIADAQDPENHTADPMDALATALGGGIYFAFEF